ncbi:TetR/AcrR family transcriptional regulator [Nocardia panacis]|uniref:TetR/AcrR family transcriptional regulator n=1 Tax=Nocardia panacis TaxID=2340916 RepID=A0A3A4K5Z6_9NOCA|nr:TetR/AcrR family transcriptional regulator [Nocardia panacis]RJO68350.1 TetR/AcrR family transcriptional regulator [Nocardia panacis]
MADQRPRERSDASRNRRAILDATRAMLLEHGAQAVTMDRVAAAAGVGKGTIFHRFGSRAGLLHELVGEPAIELMCAVQEGPPPLGPDAPARDRLLAFFEGFARLVIDNLELIVAYNAMPPHPRSAEFHGFWARHTTELLRELRPDIDAEIVAGLLLASFGGELVPTMVRTGESDRLLEAVRELVESVLRAP